MQLQSNNLNKVRALLYTILKYFFKEYLEFGSVSPFCIWGKNICTWVDSIQSGINGQYITTHYMVHTLPIFLNRSASDPPSPLYHLSEEIMTPKVNTKPRKNPFIPVPYVPVDPDSEPSLSDSSLPESSD